MNDFSERVRKATTMMDEAHQLLRYGGLEYHLREMAAAYELLMNRFAPFKIGDRVKLTKAPVINEKEAWGWLGSKHFLVPGALATVVESRCGEKGFVFGVTFDRETWMDRHGHEQPVDQKHSYCFREEWLERDECHAI